MDLQEVRKRIDKIDTKMRPLFEARMECAKDVASAKKEMGSDTIYRSDREKEIIEKRSESAEPEIRREYQAFLRYVMSVSRKYQYQMLPELQERQMGILTSDIEKNPGHTQVKFEFVCEKQNNSLSLCANMAQLNDITIDQLTLETTDGEQRVTAIVDGNLEQKNMRQFLTQISKETGNFMILELRKN